MDQTQVLSLIGDCSVAIDKVQYELDMMSYPFKADEAAIVFAHEEGLDEFVQLCLDIGVDNFNSVTDTMQMVDDHGLIKQGMESFRVRFEFLGAGDTEQGNQFRIEAMCALTEGAPVHEEHIARRGAPTLVHVSYKAPDLYAYEAHLRKLHKDGAALRACYRNTYGQFRYYGEAHRGYYVKPRVNLRDE